MRAVKALSWKAERHGHIYCAPACGFKCTWASFVKARSAAKQLAQRLGPGWKTDVWENLGWHYAAISPTGHCKVHPNSYRGKIDSYTAFLGEAGSAGGKWAKNGKTPEKAIANVLRVARAEVAKINEMIAPFEGDTR